MICYAVIDTNVLVSALLSPRDDSFPHFADLSQVI